MIRKIALVFLSIIILITFFALYFTDYNTSVIPGWHMTILSPFQSFTIIVYGWLLIVALIYIFYLRKRNIGQKNIIIYMIFTLPILILKTVIENFYFENYDVELLLRIVYFTFILFCLGQLLLLVYLIKKKPVS
jgi:hypothetical protein